MPRQGLDGDKVGGVNQSHPAEQLTKEAPQQLPVSRAGQTPSKEQQSEEPEPEQQQPQQQQQIPEEPMDTLEQSILDILDED